MEKQQRALLAASVAGVLAAVGIVARGQGAQAAEPDSGKPVACYGINKCQGMGDCGGKGHSCHGKNACNGQGYLELQKETCLKIQGGRLTEEKTAG